MMKRSSKTKRQGDDAVPQMFFLNDIGIVTSCDMTTSSRTNKFAKLDRLATRVHLSSVIPPGALMEPGSSVTADGRGEGAASSVVADGRASVVLHYSRLVRGTVDIA